MAYGRFLFSVLLLTVLLLTGCEPDDDDVRFLNASKGHLIEWAEDDRFGAMQVKYESYTSDLAEHGRWGKTRTQEINDELGRILLGKIQSLDPISVSVGNEKGLAAVVRSIDNPELTQAMAGFQEEFTESQKKVKHLKDNYTILVNLNIVRSNVPVSTVMKWKLHGALITLYSQECHPFTFAEKHDKPFATITVDVGLEFEPTEYVDTRNMGPTGDTMILQAATSGEFMVSYSPNLEKYAASTPARFTAEREPTAIVTVTNGRVNNDYGREFYEIVEASRLAEHLKLDPNDFLESVK